MKDSLIEWTHHTFNPWWGCTKVSTGCANCYAEALAKRTGRAAWGDGAERVGKSEKSWRDPLKWAAEARAAGERRRVFCASMADVFEDRPELDAPRARLAGLITATPELDWLLLTKRPENIQRMWLAANADRPRPRNVWMGTSVESMAVAARVEELRTVTTPLRFLSIEPLLGPLEPRILDGIDWVIVGGESGPKARPMHPDWVRGLRDAAVERGIHFFFKQWGAFMDVASVSVSLPASERHRYRVVDLAGGQGFHGEAARYMQRVTKERAGRLLDGREWNEVPNP